MKFDLTVTLGSVVNFITVLAALAALIGGYYSILYQLAAQEGSQKRLATQIVTERAERREAIAGVQGRYEQMTSGAREAQERTVERLSKIEATQQVQGAILQRLEAQMDRVSRSVGVPQQ